MLAQTVLSVQMTPYMMSFARKWMPLSSRATPFMMSFVAENDDA